MKKILVLALAVLLLVGTVAFAEAEAPTAAEVATFQVLEKGSQGDDVKALQEKLNATGHSVGYVDGIFGPKTEKALKELQAENGWEQTGLVSSQEELDRINTIETLNPANILKGIDNPQLGESNYENGVWREASGGSGLREIVAIEDAPVYGITSGFHITGSADDSNYSDVAIDNVPLKFGANYVLECYAKGTGKVCLQYGKGPWPRRDYDLTQDWQKYSFEFTVGNEDGSTKDSPATNIYFGVPNDTDSDVVICNMTLTER